MRSLGLLITPLLIAAAAPAQAGEVFGGVYAHAIGTPFSLESSKEGGIDLQVGYRGGRIGKTPLQPYIFGALNTSGDTSYAALGLSAKIGDRVYIRPGLGIGIHNGSKADFIKPDRIAFGSRFLAEPEVAVGTRISSRATIEASWVHMSHAQFFGGENPGLDNVGVRLNWQL